MLTTAQLKMISCSVTFTVYITISTSSNPHYNYVGDLLHHRCSIYSYDWWGYTCMRITFWLHLSTKTAWHSSIFLFPSPVQRYACSVHSAHAQTNKVGSPSARAGVASYVLWHRRKLKRRSPAFERGKGKGNEASICPCELLPLPISLSYYLTNSMISRDQFRRKL